MISFNQSKKLVTSFNPFLPGPIKESEANSADSDQMPHNVASETGLHCLRTRFSIKKRIKSDKES